MNNRQLGSRFEQEACEYLASLGMHIISRNWRTRDGEIDIIARDVETLVFVEVKYRTTPKTGNALEAIHPYKQNQIRRMAWRYLHYVNLPEDTRIRFDCIGITGDDFQYVRGAF